MIVACRPRHLTIPSSLADELAVQLRLVRVDSLGDVGLVPLHQVVLTVINEVGRALRIFLSSTQAVPTVRGRGDTAVRQLHLHHKYRSYDPPRD